jgi:hypothetical protein
MTETRNDEPEKGAVTTPQTSTRTRDGEPPIKTPDPPDDDTPNRPAEVPKVGSKDAPGG